MPPAAITELAPALIERIALTTAKRPDDKPVDGVGGNGLGEARFEEHLPGGILSDARLQNLTELRARPPSGRFWRARRQPSGRRRRGWWRRAERALPELSEGCAGHSQYDGLGFYLHNHAFILRARMGALRSLVVGRLRRRLLRKEVRRGRRTPRSAGRARHSS